MAKKHPTQTKDTKSRKSAKPVDTVPSNVARQTTSGSERSTLDPKRSHVLEPESSDTDTGAAPDSANGQLSGDLQGLSVEELADSESVEELANEGQDLESEMVKAIEDVPDADQGAIKPHSSAQPNDEVPDFKDRNRL